MKLNLIKIYPYDVSLVCLSLVRCKCYVVLGTLINVVFEDTGHQPVQWF